MKKSLWIMIALAAAALFLLFGAKVDGNAKEEHTDHCVCGNAEHATAANGHTCTTGENIPVWTGVTTSAEIMNAMRVENASGSARHSVYLYLKNDITLGVEISNSWSLNSVTYNNYNVDFHICLNGHKLTAKKNARVFRLSDNTTSSISICDCDKNADSGVFMNSGTTTGSTGGLGYIGKKDTSAFFNVSFHNGISSNYGGGILYCAGGRSYANYLYDCSFDGGKSMRDSSNTAAGGNIGMIDASTLKAYSCEFKNGISSQTGTGVAVGGNIGASGSASLLLDHCTISGGICTVNTEGKNVCGANLWVNANASGSSVVLENTTVGSDSENEMTIGGNIYITADNPKTDATVSNAEKSVVTLNAGTEVFGGKTTGSGGNIFVSTGGLLVMNSGSSVHDGTVSGSGYGGNVHTENPGTVALVASGCFRMNGGEIYNGSSNGGGNVRVGGLFYMYGGEIRNPKKNVNVFINIGQDATRLPHGIMEMSGGTIKDPASGYENVSVNGGTNSSGVSFLNAIFRMSGGNLIVSSGLKARNISSKGAVYISGGTLKSEGYVTDMGGNVRVYDSSARGTNTTVSDPKLYHPVLEITGGTFIGGTSKEATADWTALGGNIYYYTKTASVNEVLIQNATVQSGSVIASSSSDSRGGNLYLSNATFKVENCVIEGGSVSVVSGSSKKAYGGNIYVSTDADVTIKDTTVRNGKMPSPTTNGNGRNICANGVVRIQGTTYVSGSSGSTGNSVSTNLSNGRIYLESGFVDYLQLVATSSEAQVTGGTVGGANCYYGSFVFDGGRLNSNGISLSNSTSSVTVKSGYIGGPINVYNAEAILSIEGGFFVQDPEYPVAQTSNGSFKDGYYAFAGSYRNPDTSDTTEYLYEVAKGYLIEATAAMTNGDPAALSGAVSGGGIVKEGENFTLTAAKPFGAEAASFEFVGWYQTGGDYSGAPLTAAYSYTGGPVSAPAGYAAVYQVPATVPNCLITVNATAFEYAIGTGAYTAGNGNVEVPAGTLLTVKYTGTNTFDAWLNESQKLVSRETEYAFTVNGNASLTASETEDAAGSRAVFYNAFRQVVKSDLIANLTDLPIVPAESGKTNGHWTVGSETVTTVAELAAKAGTALIVNVTAAYEESGETYTVTVKGVNESAAGTPLDWTAYAAGNCSFTASLGAAVSLEKPAAATSDFLYYANGSGEILSVNAETAVRYFENVTIYAVYGTTAPAVEARVTMISALKDGTTVHLEALRDLPDGVTVLDQGILFATEAMIGADSPESALTFGSASAYKYASNGRATSDVTGLTLKNVTFKVYARAYVIYSDGTDHILYSEVVIAE